MLNLEQLRTAVAAAIRQFESIQKKYPSLKAYLVLSMPSGQVEIGMPPAEILAIFRGMVIDDAAKAEGLELISRLKALKAQAEKGGETDQLKRQAAEAKQRLEELATHFKYDEKCQVEIRFKDLDYDLVWKLQADELVDRKLTPQTKASIRIVLGTLARFAGLEDQT